MEQSLLLSDDPEIVGRREVAVSMLRAGKSAEAVMDKTGFSYSDLAVIEQTYYDGRELLDERAQTIKQMDRLDKLLDIALDQVLAWGVADEKGNFGSNLTAMTGLIREISELAGLKKKRVETEIRVIEEKQADLVVLFVGGVLDDFVTKITPLLTKNGQKQLASHREEWYASSIEGQAKVLDGTVVTSAT